MDVDEESRTREIYVDFLKFCEPVKPPHPWGRFTVTQDFFKMPDDDGALCESLRMTYGRKELRRSGVMTLDSQSRIRLSQRFSVHPGFVIPLRSGPVEKPFDLLTAEGSLSGRLPIAQAAKDQLVGDGASRQSLIFVAFNIYDVMALRAIGAPTVIASGLDEFTQESLAEVRQVFDMPANSVGSPMHLALVGWTPSRMSRVGPGQPLDRVLRNFRMSAEYFGINIAQILFWQPAITEIARLAQCLKIGRITDVADALLHSLDRSAKPLTTSVIEDDLSSLLEARRASLHRVLLNPNAARGARRRRSREYCEAVDEVLNKSLLQQLKEEPDSSKRSRTLALVEANRILQRGAVRHSVSTERLELDGGDVSQEFLQENRQLLSAIDMICRLTQEK